MSSSRLVLGCRDGVSDLVSPGDEQAPRLIDNTCFEAVSSTDADPGDRSPRRNGSCGNERAHFLSCGRQEGALPRRRQPLGGGGTPIVL